MSNDIRVLLVKLADRLHNMRTLRYIKKADKRRRIARETLDIYAPLAERVGLRWMKEELEVIAFAELEPEGYETVTTRLAYLREKGGDLVGRIIEELRRTVAARGLEAEISGREKHPYSIWRKMQERHIPFETMSDVMAFRLVVDDVAQCYQALGIVHARWPMVPGRFKDYISTPKRNGYRSLHTTVIGPQRMRIEIQIRSREMHEIAEYGVAAHWSYKDGRSLAPMEDSERYRWLRDLLDILENASSPEEFLEHTKIAMFQDTVFAFTPKGDLITMPKGSTMIDFAYAVHTEVGNHCVGAKLNGRMVPLHQQLSNGDQIEILTQKDQSPSPRWEAFALTAKARSAIRRHVRQQEQSDYAHLGRTLLDRAFKMEDIDLSDDAIAAAVNGLDLGSASELFVSIGRGERTEAEVIRAAFPSIQLRRDKRGQVPVAKSDWQRNGLAGDGAVPIQGLTPGMAVHLSDCCHPLPGDRIVGVLSPGQGVVVHTIDCEALEAFNDVPERWVDVSWTNGTDSLGFFSGRMKLVVLNESGVLATLANICAKHGGNISNLKITGREPDFFTIILDVEVKDVRHMHGILSAMRANRVVSSADRLRG